MDYLRQLRILDPSKIGKKSITLIGSGATGSYVALCLAQLGWGDSARGQGILRVFDGDKIEPHNLANQAFEISQIGMPKVVALHEIIKRKCGFDIEIYNEMVGEKTDTRLIQSNYVFLLTDTMESRKLIFDKHLQFSFKTDLVIETRMGVRDGRVYAFSPNSPDDKEEWRKTLYSDQDAEVSRCGASSSIITTVMYLASMAAQRVVHHFNMELISTIEDEEAVKINQPFWNEVQFSLYPESYYLRIFGKEPVLTL